MGLGWDWRRGGIDWWSTLYSESQDSGSSIGFSEDQLYCMLCLDVARFKKPLSTTMKISSTHPFFFGYTLRMRDLVII